MLTTRAVATLALAGALAAQSPTFSDFSPRGGQRGTEVEIALSGSRIGELQGLFFYRPGIEVLEIATEKGKVHAKLRIAPDCALGKHPFRLRTERGITTLKTFHVGPLKEIAERTPNNERSQAQPVPLETTVNGSIAPEDIDWFAVEVPPGEPVHCEVEGNRLGLDFDPYLGVYDGDGKLVTESDDTALGRKDPMVTLRSATGGRFYLLLRESAFGGSSSSHYRLHVGRFPRPVAALPAGGRPGEQLQVSFLGDDAVPPEVITLPDTPGQVYEHFVGNEHGTCPTPILLSVCDVPNAAARGGPDPVEVTLPAALHGVLAEPGAVHRFVFEAKKGTRLILQARARALRSPIDTVLEVRQIDGGYRTGSDDADGLPDSRISFKAPADGRYELSVRDQLHRGGPDYFYRIECTPPDDRMSTRISFSGRRDAEYVSVPAGGRMMTVIAASNKKNGLSLLLRGLPPGVAAFAPPFESGSSSVPVVLEAAAGAPLAGGLAKLELLQPGHSDVLPAGYRQDVAVVRVRNQQVYQSEPLFQLPVAVCDSSPFKVDIEPPKVALVQGSPLSLVVHVTRTKGFKSSIRVRLPWTPPGVGAGEVTVAGDQETAALQLSASSSAPEHTWQIAGYGFASIKGGILRTSSALIPLQVSKPWMTAKPGKVRTEQGKPAELKVALTPKRGFEGTARAKLLNLPRGVTAPELKVKVDARELRFPLAVAADAAAGRHTSAVLELVVPGPGDGLVHWFRGAEIRIDEPLPADAGTKAPTPRSPQ